MANQLKLPWQRWLISSTLLLTILFPLSISSNTWSALLVDSQKETHQFPNIYSIEIINEYPHDPKAFTEVRFFSFKFFIFHLILLLFLFNNLGITCFFVPFLKMLCLNLNVGFMDNFYIGS